MKFFSQIQHFAKSKVGNHIVDVGWLLQTNHASFIWDAPQPFRRKGPGSTHRKSVTFCPAVIDLETRLFEVPCPFDLRFGITINEKGDAALINRDGDESSMLDRALARLVVLSPQNQWRNPRRPILQIRTPYTFLSDDTVYMNQFPPFLDYRHSAWPGLVIGGRLPIHIWPRPLNWAFEWCDLEKDLIFERGQPWFYCIFETPKPTQHVRLVEAQMTQDLQSYLAGIDGVVNYVSKTFSLFSTAQQRRPVQLLVKVKR